jgi:hypothetical protein
MAIGKVGFARGEVRGPLEMTGRHWYVKKDYRRLWLIVCCVVGMVILSGVMLFMGSVAK